MYKPTYLSIQIDDARINNLSKTIEQMYESLKRYNKEVEKSNQLLREQEKLRRALNIKVVKGKTIGLVKKDKGDGLQS